VSVAVFVLIHFPFGRPANAITARLTGFAYQK
jgi:hypothetical protein